jgi:hypothetical protein
MYSYMRSVCTNVISGVRHQPLVVLTAVGSQICRIRAVVTHMAEGDASGRKSNS